MPVLLEDLDFDDTPMLLLARSCDHCGRQFGEGDEYYFLKRVILRKLKDDFYFGEVMEEEVVCGRGCAGKFELRPLAVDLKKTPATNQEFISEPPASLPPPAKPVRPPPVLRLGKSMSGVVKKKLLEELGRLIAGGDAGATGKISRKEFYRLAAAYNVPLGAIRETINTLAVKL